MPDPMNLYGVLVTYRRATSLQTTLARLRAQSRRLDRLFVVDNASDPEVEAMVADAADDLAVVYLDGGGNIGPAGGFALGMAKVLEDARDSDWIFLFDDDDPPYFDDAIESAAAFAGQMEAANPEVGGVGISGGRFDYRSGRVIRIGDAEIHGPVLVDHITAGGMPAYRVSAVRAVGGFLEELFFGFEELEFGLRLTAGGRPLFADGEQWSRRKSVKREAGLLPSEEESVARSTRINLRLSGAPWRRYYSLRNMIYILRRSGHTMTAIRVALARGLGKPIANLVTDPRAAWHQLGLNWKAIRDGFTGRMGRTVEPG